MLRLLGLLVVVSTVALSATVSAAHEGTGPGPASESDCASVTFVTTDSTAAAADVFVSKSGSALDLPPTDPEEMGDYLFNLKHEVVATALRALEEEPSPSATGRAYVEVILPRHTDLTSHGYRLAFMVDLAACTSG